MISKTSTYFLALAMFTSETAFVLSLEAKPARDINNLVRSRSTFDKLAQVQSRAFAKQDLTGATLGIEDPNKTKSLFYVFLRLGTYFYPLMVYIISKTFGLFPFTSQCHYRLVLSSRSTSG